MALVKCRNAGCSVIDVSTQCNSLSEEYEDFLRREFKNELLYRDPDMNFFKFCSYMGMTKYEFSEHVRTSSEIYSDGLVSSYGMCPRCCWKSEHFPSHGESSRFEPLRKPVFCPDCGVYMKRVSCSRCGRFVFEEPSPSYGSGTFPGNCTIGDIQRYANRTGSKWH